MTAKIIKIEYSDDGMWGSNGPAGYNVRASYAKFEKMVTTKLSQEFPGTEIEITNGISDKYHVDGDTASQDAETVQVIVGKVWESWDWLVKA